MSKRALSPIKDEDASEHQVKRQVPGAYTTTIDNSVKAQLDTTTAMLNKQRQTATTTTKQINSLMRAQHNGLNASTLFLLENNKAKDVRKLQNLSAHDHVTNLIPPCKECRTNEHVSREERKGAYICQRCGTQAGIVITETAEWREFEDTKGTKNRVTNEGKMGIEHAVQDFGAKQTKEQQRLSKVRQNLTQLRSALRFAENIYHTAYEMAQKFILAPDVMSGKVTPAPLAAVCVYNAAQHLHSPMNEEVLINAAQINKKDFKRQRQRYEEVRIQLDQLNGVTTQSTMSDRKSRINNLIMQFAKTLQVSEHVANAAKATIAAAIEYNNKFTTKQEQIVAASTLLFTATLSNRSINKHELYRCVPGTNPALIKETLLLLFELRQKIVPSGFVSDDRCANLTVDEFSKY